jgi:hypothetical protein
MLIRKWLVSAFIGVFAVSPMAYAQSDIMKLIQQHDSAPTRPGFFRGGVNNDCASLTVHSDGISGTVNGHTLDVQFDPISRVLSETWDGETTVAYFDSNNKVTMLRNSKGVEIKPSHHPQAEIDAAVAHDMPAIRAALAKCGWDKTLAKTASAKCLNDNQFAFPVGGKDCIPDYYGDEGYWDSVLAGGFDTTQFNTWQDYAECMQNQSEQKQFCSDALAIAMAECGFLAEIPIAMGVCFAAAYGLYLNCMNSVPQCYIGG